MKNITFCSLVFIPIVSLVYALFFVHPFVQQIQFNAYHAVPPPALVGPLEENTKLQLVKQIGKGIIIGPESIAFDKYGDLYGGGADGYIYKIETNSLSDNLESYKCKRFVYVGGRPLGLKIHPISGNLIVAESLKGLLSINVTSKEISILSMMSSSDNVPIRTANALEITKKGDKIYFTDSTVLAPIQDIKGETWITFVPSVSTIVSGDARGRLLEYDVKTRQTKVLMSDLLYPNGVALAHDESYVLVAETGKARVLKYDLNPSGKGSKTVFTDNLPGYPDNLSAASDGGYYIAIHNKRSKILEPLLPYPSIKKFAIIIMTFVTATPPPIGFIVKIDKSGDIVESFYDVTGKHVSSVSDVAERNGKLYIGSLIDTWVSVYNLNEH